MYWVVKMRIQDGFYLFLYTGLFVYVCLQVSSWQILCFLIFVGLTNQVDHLLICFTSYKYTTLRCVLTFPCLRTVYEQYLLSVFIIRVALLGLRYLVYKILKWIYFTGLFRLNISLVHLITNGSRPLPLPLIENYLYSLERYPSTFVRFWLNTTTDLVSHRNNF